MNFYMPWNYAKSQQPVFLFTGNIRKQPVSFSLLPMHEAMDQSGTPLGLMLRPSSICQGAVCKIWCSGFDDTWFQPKGVKVGI